MGLADKRISDGEYERSRELLYQHNKWLVDDALKRYDIDVIVTPPTGRSITVFDTAGYPLGYAKFNRRAFWLCVVAPGGREDLVIKVMSAWLFLSHTRHPSAGQSVD